MSYTDFREVSSPKTGTAVRYGSQDLLDVMQIFNGKTAASRRPKIANPWIWLGSFDITEMATPAPLPTAGTQTIFIDSADHHIKLKNSSGITTDIQSGGGGSGDMILANTQTVTGAKTFMDAKLLLRNPANTFSATMGAGAQTANRIFAFPVTAADDTIQLLATAQSPTNKTLNASTNTITDTSTALGDVFKSDGTKFVRFARGTANQVLSVNAGGTDLTWATPAGGGNVSTTSSNTYGDFDQIIRSGRLKVTNPANTFNYAFVGAAIAAARNITLPLLTADDTMVTAAFIQTLTNKTLTTPIIGTYEDIAETAAPANPASGTRRIYVDSTSHKVSVRTSAGTSVSLEEQPGGGTGFPVNVLTVATDGTGDYTTLQAAITAATTGTVIMLGPGDFTSATTINLDGKDRLTIKGSGIGVTRLITTDTSIQCIHAHGAVVGSSLPLTANTLKKSNTVTMSTANGATLTVDDWILLRSNKVIDVEFTPNFHAGELHQVRAIASGVLTLDDRVVEDYLTADSASAIKINMMEDITFQDLTIMTNTATHASTLGDGAVQFRFNKNLTLFNVEITNVGYCGLHIMSSAAPLVSNCDIHDINYNSPASDFTNYGIILHSATRDAIISNCTFKKTRHAVTMGGRDPSGNDEGYVLNAIVSNCISLESNSDHFDTHQACRYITYIGCKASGGLTPSGSGETQINGFQTRSPFSKYLECTTVDVPGNGVYAYGDTTSAAAVNKADDLVIENCDFIYGKYDTGTNHGYGIYIHNFLQRPRIVACRISNNDSSAIVLNQENDNAIIQNNTMFANGSTVQAVQTFSCDNVIFTGNRISGSSQPLAIFTQSGRPVSDKWIINNNDFTGCTSTAVNIQSGSTNILRTTAQGCCNQPAQT